VLYRPDGGDTVESEIRESSRRKYNGILPCLNILHSRSIETLYRDTPHVQGEQRAQGVQGEQGEQGEQRARGVQGVQGEQGECHAQGEQRVQGEQYSNMDRINLMRQPLIPTNVRINNKMRMHSNMISYRDIDVKLDMLLKNLELYDDQFSMMRAIYNCDSGYTRLISVAIQCLEKLYIDKQRGLMLTDKQDRALTDVSKAFIMYEGYHTHILYFYNNDTVEYQRLAKMEKRVVRVLNTSNWCWEDMIDTGVVKIVTKIYDDSILMFTQEIEDNWNKYGCYVTKYILPACYRLVRYKYKKDISKSRIYNEVDRRKVSRGEKWQYYNKTELICIIHNIGGMSDAVLRVMSNTLDVSGLFDVILKMLTERNMLLCLPI
jgi:hypothetical protein